jgi:hypothetical protein
MCSENKRFRILQGRLRVTRGWVSACISKMELESSNLHLLKPSSQERLINNLDRPMT